MHSPCSSEELHCDAHSYLAVTATCAATLRMNPWTGPFFAWRVAPLGKLHCQDVFGSGHSQINPGSAASTVELRPGPKIKMDLFLKMDGFILGVGSVIGLRATSCKEGLSAADLRSASFASIDRRPKECFKCLPLSELDSPPSGLSSQWPGPG